MSLYRTENPPGRFWTPIPLSTEQMEAIQGQELVEEGINQVRILTPSKIVTGQARSTTKQQIVGVQPDRKTTTITNRGTVDIYVGTQDLAPNNGGASNNGFLVEIDASLVLETTDEVYVTPATANTTWIVHFVSELYK